MEFIAFVLIVVAVNWAGLEARKRRRAKLEATRSTWASEEPVREVYAKKAALALLACVAIALFVAAGAMVYMLAVHGAGRHALETAALVPFASGAALGAAVAGRNLHRIAQFGSGLPWARPALRLGDDCLTYFDIVSVPWEDVVDTRDLEVSMGRGAHRAYVLLFVRRSTADYANGGKLNRREVKSAASMLRFAVQNQWPPFPKGDFVVLDVDYLGGVYAPRLKVWIDRVRRSATTGGSANGDAERQQAVERRSPGELSVTHWAGGNAPHSGRYVE